MTITIDEIFENMDDCIQQEKESKYPKSDCPDYRIMMKVFRRIRRLKKIPEEIRNEANRIILLREKSSAEYSIWISMGRSSGGKYAKIKDKIWNDFLEEAHIFWRKERELLESHLDKIK